jgi:aminodeoxyfutalosine synthase
MTGPFDIVAAKLGRGERLSADEVGLLWAAPDLVGLGMLADEARRRRHADRATFVRVADLPVERASAAVIPPGAGEVRVHGAPAAIRAGLDDLARLVERVAPTPVTVGALERFEAELSAAELAALLRALAARGVAGIAQAAVDELRQPEAAVGAVVEAGAAVARFVVAAPGAQGPWPLLERVAAIAAATGAVRAFAPLPRRVDPSQPSTGYSDVKTVAVARLALEGVPSIQVDWALYGPKLAQVALLFGADDIDGVSADDGTEAGRRRTPLADIERNIRAASLVPVERDGRFLRRGP